MRTLTTSFLATTLLAGTASIAAAQMGPLVSAIELNDALNDVRVLDIRNADADGFHGGHLPTAASAPYQIWRGPEENPGELVSVDALQNIYRELDLTHDDHHHVRRCGLYDRRERAGADGRLGK